MVGTIETLGNIENNVIISFKFSYSIQKYLMKDNQKVAAEGIGTTRHN